MAYFIDIMPVGLSVDGTRPDLEILNHAEMVRWTSIS